MAYADLAKVKSRAGILADAWGAAGTTTVDDSDLTSYLADASAEIDAAFGTLGIAVPATDPVALAALEPLAADMALLTAIDATWPGGRGGDDVAEMRDRLNRKLERFWTAVADPKRRPAVVTYLLGLLDAEEGSAAGSFWTDEADYGMPWGTRTAEEWSLPASQLPEFSKGMRL